MPKFSVTVPHTLSQEEAIRQLDRFTESVGGSDQVSDLEQSWEGNKLSFSFKTYGIQIKGIATVLEDKLELNGDLPFSAMMFKGKIEGEMKKVLNKLLGNSPGP